MATIAIDGPSGAGKSTIAQVAAKKLGFQYLNTGALYRAVALWMVEHSVPLRDSKAVIEALQGLPLTVEYEGDVQKVLLAGVDVSERIHHPEIASAASTVSAIEEVRTFLLDLQRDIAQEHSVVLDGRDIGTVVFPNADVKIFLTASAAVRAERRLQELIEKGISTSYAEILEGIEQRDYADSHRAIAPLKQAKDAVIVDNSQVTLEQAVDRVTTIIRARLENKYPDRQSKCFYNFGRAVCNLVFSAYFKIDVRGLENLPDSGTGFVVCANHRSYLDPVMMGLRMKKRYFVFMAKEPLFHKPILAPIIKKLGAFPIRRGRKSSEALEIAVCRIAEGKMMALFPEGTRSKTGKLLKPKSGVVVIAARTGADVVPASIRYYGKRPRSRVVVSYGKPIPNDMLALSDHSTPAQIKQALQIIWQQVISLYEEGTSGE